LCGYGKERLLPWKEVKLSIVSVEGKEFYKFPFLKHFIIYLAFVLNNGRLKVVAICVTEWGKWLV